jgi:hypothetical protein
LSQTRESGDRRASGRARSGSPEAIIAALRARIREVEREAAARELRRLPSVRRAAVLARELGLAMHLAAKDGQRALRHACADAYRPLARVLERQGIPFARFKLPRGRRPAEDGGITRPSRRSRPDSRR